MAVRKGGGPVVEEGLEVPGSLVEQLDFVECPAETRGVVVVPLDRLSIRIERDDVVEVAGRVLDRLRYSGMRARHRAWG